MDEATPKYFDYLGEYGAFLADRFKIRAKGDSLEADIAGYRRMGETDDHYEYAGVCIRKVLEQIVNGYLATSPYEYDKRLGKKIQDAIGDGNIPRPIGYQMGELNRLVRDAAHGDCEYGAAQHEAAVIQLDVVLRAILDAEGKVLSAKEVPPGADSALVAHSESLEDKAAEASGISGDESLVKESREANQRALDAERKAREAQQLVAEMTAKNEQLQLQIEALMQDSAGRHEASVPTRAGRRPGSSPTHMRKEPDVAELKEASASLVSDLRVAERDARSKAAAAEKAADDVAKLEERIETILSERDFISVLLGKKGHATDEQQRVVNYPLKRGVKRRFIKVEGGAGTGKTLCLLAATINYIEPKAQATLSFDEDQVARKALFLCFNKDLAHYVSSLLEGFPQLEGRIVVANYDEYLNQLVRTRPKKEYEFLAEYASDARFDADDGYWNLLVDSDEKEEAVCRAVERAKDYYRAKGCPEFGNSRMLDTSDGENVRWLVDEIAWLEGRFHNYTEGYDEYPTAERVGRGQARRVAKNSAERDHVLNVWRCYRKGLKDSRRYTLEQMVARLIRYSDELPQYDVVVVDEAQDLNMMHVELFTKFMKSDGYLMIAADERQKLYPRTFTWKSIDENVKGITFHLSVNMRNSTEIRRFAERLDASRAPGGSLEPIESAGDVHVYRESQGRTLDRVRELATHQNETTVVISTRAYELARNLQGMGVNATTSVAAPDDAKGAAAGGGGVGPGVYCFSSLRVKGLEFDNVVVDYPRELYPDDPDREKRLRYTQFTRARKSLLIRYEDEPPKLLREYYPEYLSRA